jgi:hypothetical protein
MQPLCKYSHFNTQHRPLQKTQKQPKHVKKATSKYSWCSIVPAGKLLNWEESSSRAPGIATSHPKDEQKQIRK